MNKSLSERIKLRKLIKKLKEIRGRHTELVSVYVPQGYDLTKIINNLQDEQGTATNIKDAKTSKSVISALERMIRTMKVIEKTPENGLAIFSGNVSDRDNIDDFQVFWVEPPEPLNQKLYRCDQKFLLEPLEEMESNETTYGLIAVDKSEATVGLLIGSTIKVIRNLQSTVPGKFRTGGQSAQRFERIREGAAIEFYKRVAEVVTTEFTYMSNLKGIIVGGPGTTKNNFIDGSYMNEQIKSKVIGVRDITYTNSFGLKELVDKSEDILTSAEVMDERRILQEFLEGLAKDPNMVSYGYDGTKLALEMGAVDKLILVENCVTDQQLEELTTMADASKSEINLVTDKTPEGVQFKGLTGIGAVLRYPVQT